jgi:hypothetical protein
MKYKPGDIYLIDWDDACDHGQGWHDPDELSFEKKGCAIRSVGFVLEHEGGYVRLIGDDMDDIAGVGRIIDIPTKSITRAERLGANDVSR